VNETTVLASLFYLYCIIEIIINTLGDAFKIYFDYLTSE
jgi:hypothetical protein